MHRQLTTPNLDRQVNRTLASVKDLRIRLERIAPIIVIILGIGSVGFSVALPLGTLPMATAALILSVLSVSWFLSDRLAIRPTIVQAYLSHNRQEDEYKIVVEVSNEGQRDVKKATCQVRIKDRCVGWLAHIPVDTPRGKIENLPQFYEFSLEAKRRKYVRGYFFGKTDEVAQIELNAGKRVTTSVPFPLPSHKSLGDVHDPEISSGANLSSG